MYLLIDPSEQNVIHLALFSETELHHRAFPAENREVLQSVDTFLRDRGFDRASLKGVMAVVGVGSFTSTRIAVTVANTFSYTLEIPALAITKEYAQDPRQKIADLLAQKRGAYISATYSGEPNIGKGKAGSA